MISRAIRCGWRSRMRVRFRGSWPRVLLRLEMGTPAAYPLRRPWEAWKATRRCRIGKHFQVHLGPKFLWGLPRALRRLRDSSFPERLTDRFHNACSLEPAMAANSLMCRGTRSELQLPTLLRLLLPALCQVRTKLLT